MCEILVRAVDGTCGDPTANPRRGNPVVVQPDGHVWGDCECLPEYFIVKIPGLSDTLTRPKTHPWMMKIQFEVLSSIPSADMHTIRISATEFNSLGEGKITAAKVRAFLENWGAKDIIGADNSVTFSVKILDVIQTSEFLNGLRVDDLFFEEKSYTPSTGNHRIEINYSLKTFQDQSEKDQFVKAVQENATLVSHDSVQKIIVLDILRSKVQQNLMDDVRRVTKSMIVRSRRFRASELLLTEAATACGILTIDSVKLNSNLRDVLAE